MRAPVAIACVVAALSASSASARCADDLEAPCQVPLGTYHIALPEGASGPIPALIFLHGAGGRGLGAINNTGMSQTWLDRGYAVIGPTGLPRPGRDSNSWNFRPGGDPQNERRDEAAFLNQVRADAVERFDVDPDAIVLAGFSIGGSMTSYLACATPDNFAAYAPVGGSFWRPEPTECAGPVRLLHTHGWRDQTVPLEGRPLGGGVVYQGDVWFSMQTWRRANGCAGLRADSFDTDGVFWRRVWEDCAPGTALEFALHSGGHSIPPGWSEMAIDWFEALPD